MSLINDALKKAQRRQTDHGPIPGGEADGSTVTKRGPARSAQATLLFGAGAVLLIVLSVVATVFWLDHPAPKPVAKPVATPVAPPPHAPVETSPVVIAPVIPAVTRTPEAVPPSTTAPVAPPAIPAATPPHPATEVSSAATKIEPAPSAAASSTTEAARPEAPAPDERIRQFVDAIRVTGIRSSGAESKVLMNDRVYRVNDIVDHTLGLRLTKVAPDSLTFTDTNGVTYVKYF